MRGRFSDAAEPIVAQNPLQADSRLGLSVLISAGWYQGDLCADSSGRRDCAVIPPVRTSDGGVECRDDGSVRKRLVSGTAVDGNLHWMSSTKLIDWTCIEARLRRYFVISEGRACRVATVGSVQGATRRSGMIFPMLNSPKRSTIARSSVGSVGFSGDEATPEPHRLRALSQGVVGLCIGQVAV